MNAAAVAKTYTFEAAHILPDHPGKCSRLHGHSYKVKVEVFGEVNPTTGMVVDFAVVDDQVKPMIDILDHRFIAKGDEWPCSAAPDGTHIQVIGVRTTAENLARWFAERVLIGRVVWVTVWETEKCSATVEVLRVL